MAASCSEASETAEIALTVVDRTRKSNNRVTYLKKEFQKRQFKHNEEVMRNDEKEIDIAILGGISK